MCLITYLITYKSVGVSYDRSFTHLLHVHPFSSGSLARILSSGGHSLWKASNYGFEVVRTPKVYVWFWRWRDEDLRTTDK